MAKIVFMKNSRDECMYDMVVYNKKGEPSFVAAIIHVDAVSDMGLDNYEGVMGHKDGHYRDEIVAEII